MSQELQGQIRTAIAFIGGIAVSKGWIDSETASAAVGIIVTVIAAIWSWRSKAAGAKK